MIYFIFDTSKRPYKAHGRNARSSDASVLPAKSDSDFMIFYKVIRDL